MSKDRLSDVEREFALLKIDIHECRRCIESCQGYLNDFPHGEDHSEILQTLKEKQIECAALIQHAKTLWPDFQKALLERTGEKAFIPAWMENDADEKMD